MKSTPVTIALGSPVQAHGEEIREITLRPPKGKDLRVGMPYRILADGQMAIDTEICASLISSLGAIPPSSVDQLNALDFQGAVAGVLGFFREPADPMTS